MGLWHSKKEKEKNKSVSWGKNNQRFSCCISSEMKMLEKFFTEMKGQDLPQPSTSSRDVLGKREIYIQASALAFFNSNHKREEFKTVQKLSRETH